MSQRDLTCNADELLVEGDPGMESLYRRDAQGHLPVTTVGAFGGGEGSHWLTGPVFVCGAQPGDVLQVRHLTMQLGETRASWEQRPKLVLLQHSMSEVGCQSDVNIRVAKDKIV